MEKPIPPNPDTMTETMNERARACYTVHRGACENWTHGEPAEVWRDSKTHQRERKPPLFFVYVLSFPV